MTRFASLTAALLVAVPALLAAQTSTAVSFTRAQADQGRAVYARACGSCHGQQLTDGSAVAVSGSQFREKWASPARSLQELYTLIRTMMPSVPGAGPVGGGMVSYDVRGTQYLAVASRRPSGFWVDQFPGAPTITVFALSRPN